MPYVSAVFNRSYLFTCKLFYIYIEKSIFSSKLKTKCSGMLQKLSIKDKGTV